MADPEEDLATKEERIAWLRARGVRIEEPSTGTRGGYAGGTGRPDTWESLWPLNSLNAMNKYRNKLME